MESENNKKDNVIRQAIKALLTGSDLNIEREKPNEAVIVIREDSPKIVYEPQKVEVIGNITCISEFVHKRISLIDQLNTRLEVDRESDKMVLIVHENDYFAAKITAKIEKTKYLQMFGINDGTKHKPQDLSHLFKMNAAFFESKADNQKLVALLKNFEAKVSKAIQDANDNRGNVTLARMQTVESNLPERFNMKMPIIKGFLPAVFPVEVYIDSSTLECSLWAPDVNEMYESYKSTAIENEIEKICEVGPDIVIIEK